jgi:hypothetical protein
MKNNKSDSKYNIKLQHKEEDTQELKKKIEYVNFVI